MCIRPVKLTSNYRTIPKPGTLVKKVLKDTVCQEGLNYPPCTGGRDGGGNHSHFKQAGTQDLRKKCLVQVHHTALMSHTVLRKATFYNLLLNFKNCFKLKQEGKYTGTHSSSGSKGIIRLVQLCFLVYHKGHTIDLWM